MTASLAMTFILILGTLTAQAQNPQSQDPQAMPSAQSGMIPQPPQMPQGQSMGQGMGQAQSPDIRSQSFEISPQIDYVYDPTGKKDPFKPYRAPRIKGENRQAAPVDPLTLVDVGQLKLVAVMWNISKPRAVLQDGAGRSFVVFKNMRIGRNEGVVVDIREGEVVVVEKFDDGFGNTVREAKIIEMNPPPDPSGAPAGGQG